ncbi:MAG TPA: response regulator transcription factor [Treponemataceae bacterium]|nr:response regulator transcription factor [Treponemataceae bacterium]
MGYAILMVEDEEGLLVTVGDRLVAEGYAFESAKNGNEGLAKALDGAHDLVILDVMLPGKDGFAVCRELRERGSMIPVLMLTARSQLEDKVAGLRLGADDYLCKPFEMPELLARIEALLRRAEASHHALDTAPRSKGPAGDLVVDLKRGIVVHQGAESALSAQEIKLLDYLYRHPDAIISREELLHSVWGYDPDITTRTIDVHVARLKQKLGDVNDVQRYIHTIRGIGYKFTPPD